MLFLAKFLEGCDVLVEANSSDQALDVLREEITVDPAELRQVPPGVFVAEVHWDDEGHPAAKHADAGVVCEPCSAMIGWLETDSEKEVAP